ncbi:hypothetical protein SDC9_133529 [bioreactor metagenome]|uniref:Uncharacterized protein n=1 Tax=bioreactor metagenome TaxID=1076179 RepID=A0A645DAG7_9ZZZZ
MCPCGAGYPDAKAPEYQKENRRKRGQTGMLSFDGISHRPFPEESSFQSESGR